MAEATMRAVLAPRSRTTIRSRTGSDPEPHASSTSRDPERTTQHASRSSFRIESIASVARRAFSGSGSETRSISSFGTTCH